MKVRICKENRCGCEMWIVRKLTGEQVGSEAWSHAGALSVAKSYFNQLTREAANV